MELWNGIPGLSEKMDRVNREIDRLLQTRDPLMAEVMAWLLSRRGKQLRPAMMLLSAAFGRWNECLIEFAAALEIMHMASLVHDDVVDDAKERRGVESVQSRYGKNVAVYAGDFMIFSVLSNLSFTPTKRQADYFRSLSNLCEGELLQYENLHNTELTKEDYLRRIQGKTATLFELACRVGAMESGCDKLMQQALVAYGNAFGCLFQIQDDLMDFLGASHMGKQTETDLSEGIYSLPVIFTLDSAKGKTQLRPLLQEFQETSDPEVLSAVCRLVEEGEGVVRAVEVLREYKDKAQAALVDLPDIPERMCLWSLAEMVCAGVLSLWEQRVGAVAGRGI